MFLYPKYGHSGQVHYTSGPFLILFCIGTSIRGLVRHVQRTSMGLEVVHGKVKASPNYTQDSKRYLPEVKYVIYVKGDYGGLDAPLDAIQFVVGGIPLWDFLYPLPRELVTLFWNGRSTDYGKRTVDEKIVSWAKENLEQLRLLGKNRQRNEEVSLENTKTSIHGDVILHKGKVYYINEMCTSTPTLELLDNYLDVLPPVTQQWLMDAAQRKLKESL